MTTILRFWGVRGSVPSPGPTTVEVGGNTSCIELRCGEEVLILDGGTGLRALGNRLLKRVGPVSASILFSHVHWDHIQGVPFFAPLFHPEASLRLYGAPNGGSLEEVLSSQMARPQFPVKLESVSATLDFVEVEVGRPFSIGAFSVTTAMLSHPNGVIAYRIESLGRSLVYATDTEHTEDGKIDEILVDLARDADVLIYDAQFTPDEHDGRDGTCRRGWGHSTWAEGVRIARAAEVDKLILFHHDPAHDDAAVSAIERAAQAQLPGTVAAREGMEIALQANLHRRAA